MIESANLHPLKKLITRTITGIFFIAAVIGPIFIHPLAFAGIFLVVMIIGMLEFYRMVAGGDIRPSLPAGLAVAVAAYALAIAVFLGHLPAGWLILESLIILPLAVTELFRKGQDPVSNTAYAAFAIVYLVLPLSMLSLFFHPVIAGTHPYPFLLIGFFVLLWVNDIFAYLTGIMIGRHKFFERVSPAKTWEGVAGGIIFSLVFAWTISLFIKDLSLWQWLVLAMLISISGILGDLTESMLKRRFQVKDTGWILPGHGGILDRFDALFFAAPVTVCYLLAILK